MSPRLTSCFEPEWADAISGMHKLNARTEDVTTRKNILTTCKITALYIGKHSLYLYLYLFSIRPRLVGAIPLKELIYFF